MGVIYGLHVPGGEVRYVGLTTKGAAHRFASHKSNAARGEDLPVHRWLRKHPEAVVSVLEEADNSRLPELEEWWIKTLRGIGLDLLNCTDGGDGTNGYVFTAADRARMSARALSRGLSENFVSARNDYHKGKPKSPEQRAKMSAAQRGKPRLGNHKRWHVAREVINPDCQFCEQP